MKIPLSATIPRTNRPALKFFVGLLSVLLLPAPRVLAQSTTTNNLSSFTTPLQSGLNLIVIFGFIAGCVMVMGGFLNAKRDENWKMTVIYGIGVAGAVVLMKALFTMFGGSSASAINGF